MSKLIFSKLNYRYEAFISILFCFILIVFLGIMSGCEEKKQFSISDWNIDVDLERDIISISHENLGEVLNNVSLNTVIDNQDLLVTGWELK